MESIDKIEALNAVIQQIKFYKIRITFVARQKVVLSEYKGSVFRGGMGDAFKQEVCKFASKSKCETCNLQQECAFAYMYESPLPTTHHLFGKYTHPPRPYIIIPMPGNQTLFEPGDEFYFDLILIGEAIQLLPFLKIIFFRMGEIGIGTLNSTFNLKNILGFSSAGEYKLLTDLSFPEEITIGQLPLKPIQSSVELVFQHPVRFLKAKKPFKDPPPFTMLINNLARRMTLLSHLYCGSEWVDTDRVFNLEGKTKIDTHQLQWKDWTRYSSTKEKNLYFDGHLGKIAYSGELEPWSLLLNMGTWLHAGSTATFGLGKYSIESYE